ncbi:MAG: DUF6352 family protein [Kiloniellales bacterium]
MKDFWRDSGYPLLTRRPDGRLLVGSDFLRAYFSRPELAPIAESCEAERALHGALLDDPLLAVTPEQLARLADPDARANYQVVFDFRARLLAAGTLEDCYLGAFLGDGGVTVPPLFLDQLAHTILRGLLDGTEEPLKARAAELLFREQMITLHEGRILAGDAETVSLYATTGGFGSLGRLVAEAQTPLRSVELDVLTRDNQEAYWDRDQAYDTVLDISFASSGLDAFARVLEGWVRHFLAIEVSIQPVQQIADERWVWHIGLDSEATGILNDLYNGQEVDEDRLKRLLALFRLEFAEPSVMLAAIAGRPVYLGLAMGDTNRLKVKPQNLLVNLPLAERG